MEQEVLQEKKYTVAGKVFWLGKLGLGQLAKIRGQIQTWHYHDSGEVDYQTTLEAQEDKIMNMVAIALIPEGLSKKEHNQALETAGFIAGQAEFFMAELVPEILLEMVTDFFEFNNPAAIAALSMGQMGAKGASSSQTSTPCSPISLAS